jgi:hypothetical protein
MERVKVRGTAVGLAGKPMERVIKIYRGAQNIGNSSGPQISRRLGDVSNQSIGVLVRTTVGEAQI